MLEKRSLWNLYRLLLGGWLGMIGVVITPVIAQADALIATPTLQGRVAVKSWKDLRDARVVKQDLDYSCGAASLATILSGFYGRSVTEAELLKAMDNGDAMASFADMARILPQYGFKGMGVALSAAQLKKLKVPALVYLRYRDDDHFSVVRGINEHTVWLGDPAWGNRYFSWRQFLAMWDTRAEDNYQGKALLIVPLEPAGVATETAFFAEPAPPALPYELLTLRRF